MIGRSLWVGPLDTGARASLKRRFVTGAIWSVLGAVVAQGLSLLAGVVAARALGPISFGEMAMIHSTVSMFGSVAGLGMGMTATRYLAELRAVDQARSGRILGLNSLVAMIAGGTLTAVVFLLAPFLAETVLNAPHLKVSLYISAALLFLTVLDGAQSGALAGLEAFRSLMLTRFVYGVVVVPLVILGVRFGQLEGVIAAITVAAALRCAANYVGLSTECREVGIRVDYKQAYREAGLLWRFSIPAAISGMMVGPVTWASNAIFVNQPGGYAGLGLFNAAAQWRTAIMFLPSALGNVLLPILSEQGDRSSEKFQVFNVVVSWVIGLFFATPLLALPELVRWIYGDQFGTAEFRPTLSLLMFSTIILTYKDGLARVLASRSLLWWGVLSNALWAMLLIGGTLVARPWGAIGLALVYVIAYALNTLVFVPFYFNRRLVPREAMISRPTLIIWLLVVGLVAMTCLDQPMPYRLTGLAVFIVISAKMVFRLLNPKQVLLHV